MSSEERSVELVQHDPAWATRAHDAGQALCAALGRTLIVVHHIGSTAIPGIRAKPTIDLMPLVVSLDELDAKAELVRALDYEWRGEFGMAGRRFCTLTDAPSNKRLINVHFFADGWPDVARHLEFRNYLRAHPDEAREYEAQKLRAAALQPDDVLAYNDEKGPWVKACELRARAWALTRRQPS